MEREARHRKAGVQAWMGRTNLVRGVCGRWATLEKTFGEKMGRAWKEQCEAAASQFDAGANLAKSTARRVARARRTKAARDSWGSVMVADASRPRRLENFRVSGGGNGEQLLPNFLAWIVFRR